MIHSDSCHNSKHVLLFLVIVFVCLNARSQRPNIIYIMSDDMGYGDLSGYGRKDYSTPNLDKLASQGIKLVNAYSAAPICTVFMQIRLISEMGVLHRYMQR
jgi:hypothetical protein